MVRIERTFKIGVPVRTAYNQWTQFEDFPRFMKGVIEVWQVDDTQLRARASISGRESEGDAEIAEVDKAVQDFTRFIERRGAETGGWRGEVHGANTVGLANMRFPEGSRGAGPGGAGS